MLLKSLLPIQQRSRSLSLQFLHSCRAFTNATNNQSNADANANQSRWNQQTMAKHVEYLQQQLRTQDITSYLSLHHVDHNLRVSMLAIRVLNVELAAVKEHVRDNNHGRLRMQWWRDTIDAIYQGQPPTLPLTTILTPTIDKYQLPAALFHKIIDTREKDFQDKSFFQTVDNVEQYAEGTHSSILRLSMLCTGIKQPEVGLEHAISHLGQAIGISLLIRSIPYMIHRKQFVFPMDLLNQHKIDRNAVYSEVPPDLSSAVFDLACVGKQHYDAARGWNEVVPKPMRKIFLNAISADNYYRDLEECEFNVFDSRLLKNISPLKLQLQLMGRSFSNKY